MLMETRLANRVVLVTGASGGIGGELVRAFVREGCRVVAHFAEHGDRRRTGPRVGLLCTPLGADLTLEAEVERLFAEIEAGWGPSRCWWPTPDTGRRRPYRWRIYR
jgi:3-oxoacyl-[acyl-carrier protein] reductase